MNDANEELGQAIDTVDNLAHALLLGMPAQFHVDQLKVDLPEVVQRLKLAFAKVTGENPWGTESEEEE